MAIRDYWLLGTGPSNMGKTLDTYYREYNFVFGVNDGFNPHNQFLHTFLNLGIGGFVLLIALIVTIAISAVKRKDNLLGALLFIFLIFSMTASTLSVNKGIVF
jgi:O-antigen ligase